jgi:hypothetical protein
MLALMIQYRPHHTVADIRRQAFLDPPARHDPEQFWRDKTELAGQLAALAYDARTQEPLRGQRATVRRALLADAALRRLGACLISCVVDHIDLEVGRPPDCRSSSKTRGRPSWRAGKCCTAEPRRAEAVSGIEEELKTRSLEFFPIG